MPRQSNSRQIPINELLARRPSRRKTLNEEEELQRVLELSKQDHLNHQKKLLDQFSKQAFSSSTSVSKSSSAFKTTSSSTVYPPKPKKRRLIKKEDEDEEDWFQPTPSPLLSKSKHKAVRKEPPPPVVKEESKKNQFTFEYNGDDSSSEGEQGKDTRVHIEDDNVHIVDDNVHSMGYAEENMGETERHSERNMEHTEYIENKETQMISDSDSDCSIIDLVNETTNNSMALIAHDDLVLPFVNIHQQPQGQANPYLAQLELRGDATGSRGGRGGRRRTAGTATTRKKTFYKKKYYKRKRP